MKVKFVPQNVEYEIKPGQSVLHVAQDHGIYVKSVCKGVPSCAECRVRVVEGEHNVLPPGSEELSLIGTGHFIDRRRLSCQLKCFGDITVDLNEQIAKQEGLTGGSKKPKKQVVKDDRVEQAVSRSDSSFNDEQEEGEERPERPERQDREERRPRGEGGGAPQGERQRQPQQQKGQQQRQQQQQRNQGQNQNQKQGGGRPQQQQGGSAQGQSQGGRPQGGRPQGGGNVKQASAPEGAPQAEGAEGEESGGGKRRRRRRRGRGGGGPGGGNGGGGGPGAGAGGTPGGGQ